MAVLLKIKVFTFLVLGMGCHRQPFSYCWGSIQQKAAVLIPDVKHLLVYLLHGHVATVYNGHVEVTGNHCVLV